MDKVIKLANLYIATLKSIALIHQHNHWTINGANFYGNHLLFQRLYDSSLKNLDLAAEKFIGVLGAESVDYNQQVELVNQVMSKYKDKLKDSIEMSLSVEKDFMSLSSEIYKLLDSENKLSLGLDDMIMAIASDREEAIYLLQQSK